MYYVIGSGPAAIAATVALVRAGKAVTILDVGKTLESERQEALARLSIKMPQEWTSEDLTFLRSDQKKRHGKIHSKSTYGSTYPYEDTTAKPIIADSSRMPFNYSMARGGLSNVWGGSLLPVHAKDITDWPITLNELKPHYEAILDFMPSTAVKDTLEELLPRYTTRNNLLKPSQQATAFLNDLQHRQSQLEKKGIHFGKSRIAVTAVSKSTGRECAYCGLCLYGCPYSLIYSTTQMLDSLVKENKVRYIGDRKVEKFDIIPGGILIYARNTNTAAMETFRAEHVFLGAGVLPTASIVLHSLKAFNTPIKMLDSQYFVYPFLRFAQTKGVETEALHSLAQAFLEINDAYISRHLVHLEVFGYSNYLHQALLETPLRFLLKNRWFTDQFLGRLLILQGFLHSADSGSLHIELRHDSSGNPKLHITPNFSWNALKVSLKTGLKLLYNTFELKGLPIIPAIQFAEPGRSYHSGGTFPMRSKPSYFETDITGQLPELPGVHMIDASIFTNIPATTITLTIMANAHRIATQVAADF